VEGWEGETIRSLSYGIPCTSLIMQSRIELYKFTRELQTSLTSQTLLSSRRFSYRRTERGRNKNRRYSSSELRCREREIAPTSRSFFRNFRTLIFAFHVSFVKKILFRHSRSMFSHTTAFARFFLFFPDPSEQQARRFPSQHEESARVPRHPAYERQV